MDTLTELARTATPPKPNERSSDAWVLHCYMETKNPVTRSVERDIIVSRIHRLTEGVSRNVP